MNTLGFKNKIVYISALIAIAGVFAVSPVAVSDVFADSVDMGPDYAISAQFGGSSSPVDTEDTESSDDQGDEDSEPSSSQEPADSSSNSGEGNFTTDAQAPVTSDADFAISGEFGGNTDSVDPIDPDEDSIGGEYSFTTDDGNNPPVDDDFAISGEFSFTTDDGGNPPVDDDFAISGEYSFTTDDNDDDFEISDEFTFTTDDDDDDDDDDNGGGSSSGGRWREKPEQEDPTEQCRPYLHRFIRLGYDNDPEEVLKLKVFLNEWEGFDLELTPIYDLEAYNAVREFQLRYASDILDPWGITEPTGYVFITTTLKINRIYCDDPRPIDFDLSTEDVLEEVPAARDLEIDLFNPDMSDLLGRLPFKPSTVDEETTGFLAALGFFGLDGACFICWIIIIILLLILLYLVYLNRTLKQEIRDLEADVELFSHMPDDDSLDESGWDDSMNGDVIPEDFDEDDFDFEPEVAEPEDMEKLIGEARERINPEKWNSHDIQMVNDEVESFEDATKEHSYTGGKIVHSFGPLALCTASTACIESFLCKWCWLIILILVALIIYAVYRNNELKKKRDSLYDALDSIDEGMDEEGEPFMDDVEESDDGTTLEDLIREIRREREAEEN